MRKVKYAEMGNRIRQARINLKLRQKDCLEKLGDITPQMLSDWEKGYVCPSLTYLRNISTFYNVSLDYIVFGKEQKDNDICIKTYKDALACMLELTTSGLFTINGYKYYENNKRCFRTELSSTNSMISDFYQSCEKLIMAKDSMNEELFNQALNDLLDRYNTPIVNNKQK